MKKSKLPPTDTIISLIIVTQNDADLIEERLQNIYQVMRSLRRNFEILIVDNSSSDDTVLKIKSLPRVLPFTRILILSKPYETEVALTAGLDNCVGDFAILFNIYTDPPDIKPVLLSKLLEGHDIVIGKNKEEIIPQGFLSKLLVNLVEKLSRQGFYYRQSYLMALNRKAINSIMRTRRKSRNLSYIYSLIGLKKHFIEYKHITKFSHKISQESFFDLFFDIADTIISNSFRPIRFLSFLGMFLSACYLLYVLVIVALVVFLKMSWLVPQGWISVSTVVGTLFFLLFTMLTIMSEYMIRILNETRQEPFYFISEEINQSMIIPKRKTLNIT